MAEVKVAHHHLRSIAVIVSPRPSTCAVCLFSICV